MCWWFLTLFSCLFSCLHALSSHEATNLIISGIQSNLSKTLTPSDQVHLSPLMAHLKAVSPVILEKYADRMNQERLGKRDFASFRLSSKYARLAVKEMKSEMKSKIQKSPMRALDSKGYVLKTRLITRSVDTVRFNKRLSPGLAIVGQMGIMLLILLGISGMVYALQYMLSQFGVH